LAALGAGRGSDHNLKAAGSTRQAFLDSSRYKEKVIIER